MKKRIASVFLSAVLTASTLMAAVPTVSAEPTEKTQKQPKLVMKYDEPAEKWENQALPLGNGFIGAMVFGGVGSDRIQTNEHTLWSGGPGANADYNGGNDVANAKTIQANLQKVRGLLQAKVIDFSQNNAAHFENGKLVTANYPEESDELKEGINGLMGSKNNFGDYQTLGNIMIAEPGHEEFPPISVKSNAEPANNPSEVTSMLFDGNLGTKWYADGHSSNDQDYQIDWQYSDAKAINSYNVSSANDAEGRDPTVWKLYGSNDGTNYELIDEQSGVNFTERQQTKNFIPKYNRDKTYTHYRILITELREKGLACQLSEIEIVQTKKSVNYSNYLRTLDIDNAVATVSYKDNDKNCDMSREYFISNPGNVMAIKMTASEGGKLDRTIAIASEQSKKTVTSAGDTITMTGQPADQNENGLKFAEQVKVIAKGGKTEATDGHIKVTGADEIVIFMTAGTNYKQCTDSTFNFFKDGDPLDDVKSRMSAAVTKGYDKVKAEHIADYKSLYGNVKVSFGANDVPSKMTDNLLGDYNKTNSDNDNRYLEDLYYQYGRYLLIASSRKGSLPANLQGIWAEGLSNPWSSDYHTNINLQMNYWLAEQTNLSECHEPLFSYIDSLVPRGEITAKTYYCTEDGKQVRGWVTNHENNIWGHTAPSNYYWGFYFPAAAAWLCQDIYEYYKFNDDEEFIKENYDTMLSAALFWVDNLVTDSRDGTLVASPSFSPEHGMYSLGASSDQGIISELFREVIEISDDLGYDTPEVQEIKAAKAKLYMPKIGLGGELLEWKDEQTMDIDGDNQHRHANHLFLFHPGSEVVKGRSEEDNKMADAIQKVLETRGDSGTGWSKAWKINFWARLYDGDHAMTLIKELFGSSTLSNLFDTHPPFQIDGNFGATAGMTEMLIQSQGDYIKLLPALPTEWKNGNVSGVKARGNFEISMNWQDGKIDELDIKSNSGNTCVVEADGIGDKFIVDASTGKKVEVTKLADNKISFKTAKGASYSAVDTYNDEPCDLYVSDASVTPSNANDGDMVKPSVTIRNMSNVKSTGTLTVKFMVDGRVVDTVTCKDEIEAGGKITVNATKQVKAFFGSHTVKASVVTTQSETDTANNLIKRRFAVRDD